MSRWIVAAMWVAFLYAAFSCGTHHPHEKLQSVNAMTSENPVMAISMLDSVDAVSLEGYNRHFYDFLAIKTADKAYVTHRSDSLYRKVEGYFSKHKDDPLYPEVLYYGGRVYSDLGDYPRALQYFQGSLELIPGNKENLQLRLNALSQTGRLLTILRLYDEAISYFTDCVDIDRSLNDTINLFYDYILLETVFRHKKDYHAAETLIKKCIPLAKYRSEEEKALLKGEIAILKFYQGYNDSSLMLMRGVPEKVASRDKDYILSHAASIFYKNNILDTAYLYARKVKDSDDPTWSRSGYKILLSLGVKKLSHPDTLDIYLKQYLDVLEKVYNNNQNEASLLQNTRYNYSIYEKDNLELINKKKNLSVMLCLTLFVIVLAVTIILSIKYRNIKIREELKDALLTISNINYQYCNKGSDVFPVNGIKTLKGIKEALKKETEVLSEVFNHSVDNNRYISTESYKLIQECLTSDKNIPNSGWQIILKTIEDNSPGFSDRINRLSIEQLSEEDLRLIYLIKMGVNATNVSKLMSKSKGTITYRRKKLRDKLNLGKISLDSLDKAIRLI